MAEPLDYLLKDNAVIWVFGYGSLLWKPDFSYRSKVVGFIDGYVRRFNQGNETFRGIPGKPGRVANLEEKPGCKTWGVAYEISGKREVAKVLQDLYVRESCCGGYNTMITTFYPREYAAVDKKDSKLLGTDNYHDNASVPDTTTSGYPNLSKSFIPSHVVNDVSVIDGPQVTNEDNSVTSDDSVPDDKEASMTIASDRNDTTHHPVQVLLYTATVENELYLGSDTMSNIARQVVDSKGTAGTNVEYVVKIADYIRRYIPEDDDEYLFGLDAKIREEIYRRINSQRTDSNGLGNAVHDPDIEHHEALLKAIRVKAS